MGGDQRGRRCDNRHSHDRRPAIQRRDFLLLGDVPDLDLAIRGAGEQGSVRGVNERLHGSRVAFQRRRLLTIGEIPNANFLASIGGGQLLHVAAPRQRADRLFVGEGPAGCAIHHVPQPHGFIGARRGDRGSVG